MRTGRATGGGPWWRSRAARAGGGLAVLAAAGAVAVGATADDGRPAPQLKGWALAGAALPVPVDDALPAAPPPQATAAPGSDDAAPDAPPDAGSSSAPPPDTLPSGAPSDDAVKAELRRALRSAGGDDTEQLVSAATVGGDGLASVPPDAPGKVAAIIRAGNQVARKPYVYGGGHGRLAGEIWQDSAYDCSGSISFALAAAGLIDAPMTSGALAAWGKPGPGRWVTIYANDGHTFMTVAGLRFDTSGRQQTGSRWQTASRSTAGFRVVHPPGL
ncbi:hypothetical protein [Patulibacter sp. SYSU D01012]|uniref:hypothetical protein n=1 Tax=Patulibacter sp. SYSU D01012 TaxID=2817381 RepID=UPI001B30482C|nr:hypothetical protein [Patulibacter sp. SYSU D01012]